MTDGKKTEYSGVEVTTEALEKWRERIGVRNFSKVNSLTIQK